MDSVRTLPSLALVKNLQPQGFVPDNWKTRPVFSKINGKSAVTITFDEHVDLYGNGEVTGTLKRNNTKVTLWNTDNYTYSAKDNGTRLPVTPLRVLGVRKDKFFVRYHCR